MGPLFKLFPGRFTVVGLRVKDCLRDFLCLLLHRHGSLALAVTEVVQLGTTDRAALFHLYLGDTWGVNREHTLYSLAKADTADGEIRIDSRAFAADDDPGVLLDTLFVTFNNAGMNANGIAYLKLDEVGLKLFFFDGGDDAHVRNIGRKVI